jgi:hypothetical protein
MTTLSRHLLAGVSLCTLLCFGMPGYAPDDANAIIGGGNAGGMITAAFAGDPDDDIDPSIQCTIRCVETPTADIPGAGQWIATVDCNGDDVPSLIQESVDTYNNLPDTFNTNWGPHIGWGNMDNRLIPVNSRMAAMYSCVTWSNSTARAYPDNVTVSRTVYTNQ